MTFRYLFVAKRHGQNADANDAVGQRHYMCSHFSNSCFYASVTIKQFDHSNSKETKASKHKM